MTPAERALITRAIRIHESTQFRIVETAPAIRVAVSCGASWLTGKLRTFLSEFDQHIFSVRVNAQINYVIKVMENQDEKTRLTPP